MSSLHLRYIVTLNIKKMYTHVLSIHSVILENVRPACRQSE